jgi:hypothetical protein
MDKLENLKKLKQLFDDGVLSEKEYSEMKNEIIDNTTKSQVKPVEVEKDGLLKESLEQKPKNILEHVASNSTLIDGVYLTENENVVKSLKFVDDISGWSGWSGLAENLGIKNAEKKLIKKAKEMGANVVLITGSSTDWGVKIKGKSYKM